MFQADIIQQSKTSIRAAMGTLSEDKLLLKRKKVAIITRPFEEHEEEQWPLKLPHWALGGIRDERRKCYADWQRMTAVRRRKK